MTNFGPSSASEAQIFAEENLRVDIQHRLQTVMNHLGVKQSDLAVRLGRSEAFISQVFDSKMNITVRTMARIFHALGDECVVTSATLLRLGHAPISQPCRWISMATGVTAATATVTPWLLPLPTNGYHCDVAPAPPERSLAA